MGLEEGEANGARLTAARGARGETSSGAAAPGVELKLPWTKMTIYQH